MDPRNKNYVQMVNQEFNINQSGTKMNLLKTFKSKKLPKSCSRFLSLIVTFSVLSVANSTLAFPAKVRENYILHLYYAPPSNLTNIDPPTKGPGPVSLYYNKSYRGLTLVDILYCRNDNWCYILGYYSQGSTEAVGYYSDKAWVLSTNLCDDQNSNDQTNPLPSCSGNSNRRLVVTSANSFNQFLCNSKDDKGVLVQNPWQWFFSSTNPNFCSPNSP